MGPQAPCRFPKVRPLRAEPRGAGRSDPALFSAGGGGPAVTVSVGPVARRPALRTARTCGLGPMRGQGAQGLQPGDSDRAGADFVSLSMQYLCKIYAKISQNMLDMRNLKNMQKICKKYAKNMPNICTNCVKYAQICTKYARKYAKNMQKNMHKICQKYAQNMQKYAKNMQQIC